MARALEADRLAGRSKPCAAAEAGCRNRACENVTVLRGGVDETRGETVRRRLRTIPPLALGLLLATALLPLLIVVALATDLVRRIAWGVPPTALRLVVFMWVYLAAEVLGLLALGAVWVASAGGRWPERLREATWRIQQLWAGLLFGAVRRLFDLRLELTGDDAVAPGPVIVLIRHASIVDNLLPAIVVSRPHGIRLRYVLKRELLSDPCLDVAGMRLPNYFVRRGTGSAEELERIRELARGLGAEDGVLIYPEGTRFTLERREREIARLAERDAALADRAARLGNLLAPKPGGVGALLDGSPASDVLVVGHRGFEGLRLISDIWRGGLVRLTIKVRVTRVPRAQIPSDGAGRVDWLYGVWQELDDWIEQNAAVAP